MQTLNVDLGTRSYPIFIGSGLLGRPELVQPYAPGKQVMIVSNETVAPLYLERATQAFAGKECRHVILPDGEKYKTLDTLNLIFDALLTHNFSRNCTLVALGGGVVGDITGYAAASYQRGVAFIQIPTTLLSQVDSSVGGKTGVNHALGKNMIGAFHQPTCVIADTGSLNTLDDRQLRAGVAEVIKYGLISDPEFFAWLEQHLDEVLARDPAALAYAIARSCQDKADVVGADEREGGLRAILNLGHTFGHAIETATHYETWLHGEAVATGMLMAADLSQRLGWLSTDALQRAQQLIARAGLPLRPPTEMTRVQFLQLMARDKKVLDGAIRLVLLKGLGQAIVTADYAASQLQATLDAYCA
ncbi:MAG: 3-dehydroquinate synthase [Gammaproteobacteria bacterium]|nr:3-dehydroquinate synthase [Gammaproteobacteria bacterium]